MSRRGTTVVAWVIGLGALAAQMVVVPVATAIVHEWATAPVEVTLPAIEVTAPALPAAQQAEPVTRVDPSANDDVIEVVAQVG